MFSLYELKLMEALVKNRISAYPMNSHQYKQLLEHIQLEINNKKNKERK